MTATSKQPAERAEVTIRGSGLQYAASIIHAVCRLAGAPSLIDDFRIYLWQRGIVEAVDHHIPTHRLRNGRLNQTAYSLFLFIRDVADSDLVGWIDARLRLMSPVHQTGSHVFDKPCWRLWDRYSVSQIRS